jgi:malate synthase
MQVFAWADSFLNEAVPLANGADWSSVTSVGAKDGALDLGGPALANPAQFVGYTDNTVLLKNNGLHIELKCVQGTQGPRAV